MDYSPLHQSFRCTPETLSDLATQENIEAWLMSLQQDSPASPLPLGENEGGQAMIGTHGQTPFALLEKLSLNGFYWRTPQSSFHLSESGDFLLTSIPFSETWPQSGMMQCGAVYPLPVLEPITNGNGSGLLPTPVARDGPSFYVSTKKTALNRIEAIKENFNGKQIHWMQYSVVYHDWSKGWANPRFAELMMGYPIGWTDLQPLEMGKFQLWLKHFGN